jgi:hypothetical protein
VTPHSGPRTLATDWHRGCSRWARDNLEAVYDWFEEYSVGVIVLIAVVISKADLPAVREKIGDVREGPIRGDVCREAIVAWDGENVLRALRTRFRSVEYFACSPLGREADRRCRDPFQGSGLLEPLAWILAGAPAEGVGPDRR